jgi:hypothetical protein
MSDNPCIYRRADPLASGVDSSGPGLRYRRADPPAPGVGASASAAAAGAGAGGGADRGSPRFAGLLGGLVAFVALVAAAAAHLGSGGSADFDAAAITKALVSRAGASPVAFQLARFAPYLAHMQSVASDVSASVSTAWAGSGIDGPLVHRIGDAPTVSGATSPLLSHFLYCALFNNPVDQCIAAPASGGAGVENLSGYFGGASAVPVIAKTLHFYARALVGLGRRQMPFFDCWPLVAPGLGVGAKPSHRPCVVALQLLLNALFAVGFVFMIVATGDGWDTLVKALDKERCVTVACPVMIVGVCHDVTVLVYSPPFGVPRFFVKSTHFCMWDTHRSGIVASLVCLFELAGVPVAPGDVEALLAR